MAFLPHVHDILGVNSPSEVTDALSKAGSDWLWAVTAIYLVSFFGVLVPCFTTRESDRVFHYLYTLTILVGGTTYFAAASNLGWSVISSDAGSSVHQVFFVRYVNWAVSFPAAALGLGLLSSISWTTIVTNIVCAWLWVITYAAAAYTSSTHKWGFYAFGTFAYLILALSTLNESREAAQRLGIGRDYTILAAWTNLMWLLYPVAFALTDGAHVINAMAGCIFVGVLDILMMPVWSVAFILLSRRWDYKALHLNFSEHRFHPGDEAIGGSRKG